MSIWVQGRRTDHGRARYSIGIPFEALGVLGILVGCTWIQVIMLCPDALCAVALGCLLSGLAFIAMAKVPLFRRGIWRSWGPRQMTRPFAVSYGLGYALLATGAVLLVVRAALATFSCSIW